MSADMPNDPLPQSLSVLEEIDAACDHFEHRLRAALSSESRPRIEDYGARASAHAQRELVRGAAGLSPGEGGPAAFVG
jgi:hypothetical protein